MKWLNIASPNRPCCIQGPTILFTFSNKTLLSRPSFLCPSLPPDLALDIALRNLSLSSILACRWRLLSSIFFWRLSFSSLRCWARRVSFRKGTGFGRGRFLRRGNCCCVSLCSFCLGSVSVSSNMACLSGCSSSEAEGPSGGRIEE